MRHASMVPLTSSCYATGGVANAASRAPARVTWTVVSIFVVECLVFGLSGLPAFLFWTWALSWATPPWPLVRPLDPRDFAGAGLSRVRDDADSAVGRHRRACSAGARRRAAPGGSPISSGGCSTGRAT